MRDIENKDDIKLLVDSFYKQVIPDELIGHFFTEVVELSWDKHMPVMYDFWESTLLGNMKYKGNPMLKHLALNDRSPILAKHFERWLLLWTDTVSANFEGPTARMAIERAGQIASLMRLKIQKQSPLDL